uniref:Uncharacterized protein n=1 Tax=Zea mays TaxID=4577 RepID=C0HHV6_MAIZE|nr:unknown [Zea mays]
MSSWANRIKHTYQTMALPLLLVHRLHRLAPLDTVHPRLLIPGGFPRRQTCTASVFCCLSWSQARPPARPLSTTRASTCPDGCSQLVAPNGVRRCSILSS